MLFLEVFFQDLFMKNRLVMTKIRLAEVCNFSYSVLAQSMSGWTQVDAANWLGWQLAAGVCWRLLPLNQTQNAN